VACPTELHVHTWDVSTILSFRARIHGYCICNTLLGVTGNTVRLSNGRMMSDAFFHCHVWPTSWARPKTEKPTQDVAARHYRCAQRCAAVPTCPARPLAASTVNRIRTTSENDRREVRYHLTDPDPNSLPAIFAAHASLRAECGVGRSLKVSRSLLLPAFQIPKAGTSHSRSLLILTTALLHTVTVGQYT